MGLILVWNVLRTLAESRIIIENEANLLEFDNLLTPCYQQLANPDEICFDDDILDIIMSTSKITKSISPNMKACIVYFPMILEKYKGQISQLLGAFNCYFLYAKDVFQESKAVDMVIDIGVKSTIMPNDQMVDMHKTEGTLLFHILIQIIPECLENHHWVSIFDHAASLLKPTNDILKEPKDFFIVRVLGIFLSGLIQRPELVFEYLCSKDILRQTFDMMFNNLRHFKSIYDRKLIIMGLASFWQYQFDNESLSDLLLTVWMTCIYMLIIQQYKPQLMKYSVITS